MRAVKMVARKAERTAQLKAVKRVEKKAEKRAVLWADWKVDELVVMKVDCWVQMTAVTMVALLAARKDSMKADQMAGSTVER